MPKKSLILSKVIQFNFLKKTDKILTYNIFISKINIIELISKAKKASVIMISMSIWIAVMMTKTGLE